MQNINKLKEIIANSNNIVVFTGAGISCPPPSNIPDFRSDNGLYSEKLNMNYSPEDIISRSFFYGHTSEFFDYYFKKMVYPKALPNLAHFYFAKLEEEGKVKAIVTQNIDGLHQLAGSKNVYELHGSVLRNYCTRCQKFYHLNELDQTKVNRCECGGLIKPDVVLYEEPLDGDIVLKAIKAIENADTLIIVGTSLSVYPAASFVTYFKGKNMVIINKSLTRYDNYANVVINDDIINVINKLTK